jgi:hypothetical protein
LSQIDDTSIGPSALGITSPITIEGSSAGIEIARAALTPSMRLFFVGPGGNLTLQSLTLTQGRAVGQVAEPGRGGAVYVSAGSQLRIIGSTFTDNAAFGEGGRGGAIYGDSCTVTILNSTFAGSSVRNHAGAPAGFGGGIYVLNGVLSVYNSTLAETAPVPGSGIYVLGDGQGATLRLYNSIVAAVDEYYDVIATLDNGGAINISAGHNLLHASLPSTPTFGAVSADPQLAQLSDNGGPTKTFAFLDVASHPAIDMGDPNFDPADPDGDPLTDDTMPFDQRGASYARVADGDGAFGPRIDIGAFEFVPELPGQPLPGDYNGDLTVNAADYTVWRNTLGTAVARYVGADGDGSRLIDPGDFQVWKDHYGETLEMPAAGAAIQAERSQAPPAIAQPATEIVGSPQRGDGSATVDDQRSAAAAAASAAPNVGQSGAAGTLSAGAPAVRRTHSLAEPRAISAAVVHVDLLLAADTVPVTLSEGREPTLLPDGSEGAADDWWGRLWSGWRSDVPIAEW